MPNQCLYNSIIIPSPWSFIQGSDSDDSSQQQIERLHQQSQLPLSTTAEYSILTLEQWQSSQVKKATSVLLINGFEEIDVIRQALQGSTAVPGLILIDFPVFTDGRGYSLARLLKREHWLNCDIGAIGDILQDQIFFYWRCGFDAIIPRHDQDIHACKKALHSFSHVYQPAEQQPEVLV